MLSGAERQRRYTARHPDKQRAATEAWVASNPEQFRAIRHRAGSKYAKSARGRAMHAALKAARKFGEVVAFSDWWSVWTGTCFGCGKTPAEGVDHIIPASRGGRNILGNLQPACLPCNTRKWAN